MTSCTVPNGVNPGKFYGAIALMDHSYWILGSFIGTRLLKKIPDKVLKLIFIFFLIYASYNMLK